MKRTASGGPLARPLCALALVAGLCATHSFAQTTVTFQQGVDGYAGTLDLIIGGDDAEIPGGAGGNQLGSASEEQFLDGRYFDVDPAGNNADDKQLLIRFDDIIGNAAGQVPAGARITEATLTLHGGVSSGSARSGGPYGVAQLLLPFTDTSSWNTFGGNGATFSSGETDRPFANGFRGGLEADTPAVADVTRAVQEWANGAANHGLVVRAGTTDGWQVFMTGAANADVRPKLSVTYEPASTPLSSTVTLQNGAAYNGTTMAWLRQNDTTSDGTTLDTEFLDGPANNSSDDQALIRFGGIFASEGGPVPDGAPIREAFLVLDTASATRSMDAGTNGSYSVHQMLVDWNLSNTYSGFGGNGPDEAGGEVGPPLDLTGAMIADTRAYLDVTEAVRNWQAGEANFGLSVKAFDTADGWAIHWLGSASPPQLVVSFVPEPSAVVLVAIAGAGALACTWARRRSRSARQK